MVQFDKCVKICGSPYVEKNGKDYTDKELLQIYDFCFENRVALLYLDKYRYKNWDEKLEKLYTTLANRQRMTIDVLSTVGNVFNQFDPKSYSIFKSLKPFPATPNDTDIIFMKDKKKYKEAMEHLIDKGYKFHEWAPQQKTFYDQRGEGKIGRGKKGGTYYIDFYEEISTDYFAYLNKNALKPYIVKKEINGVLVNLLRPEPELAIVLFHNLFPERTYQLEHFYLPLYYLKDSKFDKDLFLNFVKSQKLTEAIKANFTFCAFLHEKHFNFVPDEINYIINKLGTNKTELKKFVALNAKTPYMFSPYLFFKTFVKKSFDAYALKSVFYQLFKMLNPVFFFDVIRSVKNRLSESGTYHHE